MAGPPPDRPHRRRAAALSYDAGRDDAPRLTAAGAGVLAERILDAAREAGVPVREDPALVQALAGLQLGGQVPPALWQAVAETLAWAYRLQVAPPPAR
jgi:flagellar biosynthesis protein